MFGSWRLGVNLNCWTDTLRRAFLCILIARGIIIIYRAFPMKWTGVTAWLGMLSRSIAFKRYCNLHFYGTINKEAWKLFQKMSSRHFWLGRLDEGAGWRDEHAKIYEIEFFISFYGTLNVVDWSTMNYGTDGDAGMCRGILEQHKLGRRERLEKLFAQSCWSV